MPHNLDFIRDDEVSICQIDLPNICFNDDVNEFLKSISDSIGIENFPKEVESFVYREKKQLFIGDELYLYDAF